MATYRLDNEALQPKYDSMMHTYSDTDMDMCRSLMEDMTRILDHSMANRDDVALADTLLDLSARAMAWRESISATAVQSPPARHLSVVR